MGKQFLSEETAASRVGLIGVLRLICLDIGTLGAAPTPMSPGLCCPDCTDPFSRTVLDQLVVLASPASLLVEAKEKIMAGKI